MIVLPGVVALKPTLEGQRPTGTPLARHWLLKRSEEYIIRQKVYKYLLVVGIAAMLGSIQPQSLDFADDTTLLLDEVAPPLNRTISFRHHPAADPGEYP